MDTCLFNAREIRNLLARNGVFSQTSTEFQDDLLRIAGLCYETGGDFVELGCFRGGISAQLAALALRSGRRVIVCDINPEYLTEAKTSIDLVGASKAAELFQGTLADLSVNSVATSVGAIFIDGDHRYEGVMRDIEACRSFRPKPRYLIFHDFGLRSGQPELISVRVDLALMDAFRGTAVFRPMGVIAGFETLSVDRNADAYYEPGLPEGAWCDFG